MGYIIAVDMRKTLMISGSQEIEFFYNLPLAESKLYKMKHYILPLLEQRLPEAGAACLSVRGCISLQWVSCRCANAHPRIVAICQPWEYGPILKIYHKVTMENVGAPTVTLRGTFHRSLASSPASPGQRRWHPPQPQASFVRTKRSFNVP